MPLQSGLLTLLNPQLVRSQMPNLGLPTLNQHSKDNGMAPLSCMPHPMQPTITLEFCFRTPNQAAGQPASASRRSAAVYICSSGHTEVAAELGHCLHWQYLLTLGNSAEWGIPAAAARNRTLPCTLPLISCGTHLHLH